MTSDIDVHRILEAWYTTSVTWTDPWMDDGCGSPNSCEARPLITFSSPSASDKTVDVELPIGLVQQWVDGGPDSNHGVALGGQSSPVAFHSMEAETALRPTLEVEAAAR